MAPITSISLPVSQPELTNILPSEVTFINELTRKKRSKTTMVFLVIVRDTKYIMKVVSIITGSQILNALC